MMGENVFVCWWYMYVENVVKVIWRAFLAEFYVLVRTGVSSYV